MLVGNGGQQVIGFAVFAYLAHTLAVADFGLMALAAAVIDLLTVFGRFGQVEALMQRGRIEERPASTSFWLLCGIGLALMLAVVMLAAPLAAAFGEPKIFDMLLIMAGVPLLHNLGQVHEAHLRSAFSYRSLAARNFLAAILGGAASVAAAAAGLGVSALIIQKLVFTAVYTLSVWIALPWRPRLQFSRPDAARLSKVGFDVVTANLINMLNPRIVDLFVGYFLGVVALGYLRIAWRLFDFIIQLVIQPISNVAISSFTQLRNDRERIAQSFLRYLQFLALVAFPAFIGIGLLSGDLIHVVAGPKWDQSARLLAILSAAALAMPVGFLFPPAMIAVGRSDLVRWQALAQTLFVVLVTFAAAQIGIVAVMVVHVARVYLFAAINTSTTLRLLPIPLRDLAYRWAPPAASALVMAACVWAAGRALGETGGPVERLAILSCVGAVSYVLALALGDVSRLWSQYLKGIVATARDLIGWKPRISAG
jgi:O-antigen/teichoic acid export membrane protein